MKGIAFFCGGGAMSSAAQGTRCAGALCLWAPASHHFLLPDQGSEGCFAAGGCHDTTVGRRPVGGACRVKKEGAEKQQAQGQR